MLRPSAPKVPAMCSFDDLLAMVAARLRFVPQRSLVHELHDLWKMGAPTPDSGPGRVEQRVILPAQFNRWWDAVVVKYGEPAPKMEIRPGTFIPMTNDERRVTNG